MWQPGIGGKPNWPSDKVVAMTNTRKAITSSLLPQAIPQILMIISVFVERVAGLLYVDCGRHE